jgi:hypothetical protein
MAGARSLRGNNLPTPCISVSAGVRGAKVNRIDRRVNAARRSSAAAMSGAW